MTELRFKRIHSDVILPRRWSDDAVGWDIHAFLLTETGRTKSEILPPNTTRNIATGLFIEPPPDHFVMVCSRSGLAKKSIIVMNAPGIIDPDYRGELRVLLYNGSHQTQWVQHQERIAQLFLVPVTKMTVVEVSELTETDRGEKGFGSTGS